MLLTIAIPAHNKSKFLKKAVYSIKKEIVFGNDVNLIISDNSLNNDIKELYLKEFKNDGNIKLYNSKKYKCLDSNVNRAVELSSGKYVWIFGDDDLIVPGILIKIKEFLKKYNPSMVIMNSKSFRDKEIIEEYRLPKGLKPIYEINENDKFLIDLVGYLTYVGGILVDRELWMANYDKSKIGSFFAHIACITAIKNNRTAHYFSSPAIKMRLGSQTWIDKSFLIWHKLYPEIIWGLKNYNSKAKRKVIHPNPLNSLKTMIASRAYGRLTFYNYQKFIFPEKNISINNKILIFLIAILPKRFFSFCYAYFILLFKKNHSINFSPKLALSQLNQR